MSGNHDTRLDTDVLIVGGGIQGAGVAQAAAAAGYRVRVVEQTAVGSGTSSRSSKLIHGGLRYLESGQFALVRKALRERHLLLRNAPELVHLLPIRLPVYAGSTRPPWKIWLGLSLYALLGGLHRANRFCRLSRKAMARLPIRQTGLRTVFEYFDAQTDDRALTRAVMASACNLGAELWCPAAFVRAESGPDHVRTVVRFPDREMQVTSRVLINAAGPWVDRVLANVTPTTTGPAIDLVQGTHIVLAEPAPDTGYYVEAPQDRRAVFILPWQGRTLVGTTETTFHGDPARVRPLAEEIDYLLQVYRYAFPDGDATLVDAFTGLRVLPKTPGSFFSRPRDTLLHAGPSRVLSLYGGKLTSYRATAEAVMACIHKWLPPRTAIADTRELRLEPVDEEGMRQVCEGQKEL